MRNSSIVSHASFLIVVVALVCGGERRAAADIPPPDACTAPGQPCNNAGPAFNQSGTCTASTCTRTVPGTDGGTMLMSYACNLCKVTGTGGTGGSTGTGGTGTGGSTGSGGDTGTGGGGTDAGGTADAGTASSSKGCGCAVADPATGGWAGRMLVLLGLFGFVYARRRRRP